MSTPAPHTTPELRRRAWLAAALVTVMAGTATAVLAPWLDPTAGVLSPWLWLLNALPFALLWLLGWLLLGRALLTSLLVLAIAALFYFAHASKMATLAQPLLPSDLSAVPNLLGSPELFLRYLTPAALGMAAGCLLLAIAALRWEPPILRGKFALRLGAMVAVGIAGITPFAPWGQSVSPYTPERLRTTVWNMPNAAQEIGAVALFAKLLPQAQVLLSTPPPEALAATAAHCDDRVANGAAMPPPAVLPDLVVVQSESFFDPTRLRGLEALPVLTEYRRLSEAGVHGELVVPAYGGLTTRTEFEFLTGFPLMTLPSLSYPFQALVHQRRYALPWALQQAGYRTLAAHPYDAQFYRRDRVYPLLGFQAFHAQDSFDAADVDGYYISDHSLLARMRSLLDEGEPQLLFAVTMENHGPWDEERPVPAEAFADIALPPDLSEQDAGELRRYLHHLANADRSLGELADWVMQRQRPTLLLFYGDHLPALHGVYRTLGFNDGRQPFQQPTPWLLLDNRRHQGERRDAAAYQLAGLLLDAAGLHQDRYFATLACLAGLGEQAMPLQAAVATDRLTREIDVQTALPQEEAWAPVADWGPPELEAQYGAPTDVPHFWLRVDGEWPAGASLQFGAQRLKPLHRSGSFLLAEAVVSRLGQPGERVPLRLVDPTGLRQQLVGEVQLTPPAPRLTGDDGRASRLCAIETWGPELSPRRQPVNLQPDGRMGVWIRAACMPNGTRIEVDGEPVDTTILGHLATAAVRIPDGDEALTLTLALRDTVTDTRIMVGTIRLSDD